MTIFFPDLSHYDLDRGVRVEPGTVAVIVKGTHGTRFVDRAYTVYRDQAAGVGAYFTAYHWLNHGDGAGQARYCWQQLGRVPVMVDAEDQPGNTGYTGPLAVQDIADFVTTLRDLGGIANLVYLPRWYWSGQMGSPDLSPLGRLRVGLVSSNYTTYSDSGPGWSGYGGLPVAQWQYSDNLPYGGSFSDFNAFQGSLDEYRALTSGGMIEMSTDWGNLGPPKNFGYSSDVAAVDVWDVLYTGAKTGWSDADGGGWWVVKVLKKIADDVAAARSSASLARDAASLAAQAAQSAVDGLSTVQTAGVDLDLLAAKIAPLIPAPPSAAEVAEEIAKRLGNG